MDKIKTIEQIALEEEENVSDLYQALIEQTEKDDTLFGYITAWNKSENPAMKDHFVFGMVDYLKREGTLHEYRTSLFFINQMPDNALLHIVAKNMIEAHPITGRLNFCYAAVLSLFDNRTFVYKSQSE